MNYFEVLGIDESVTDEQAIADAYQKARIKWQTILNQGVGQQQQTARELMNGRLETAYETLSNPSRRQQYLRALKLSQETGVPVGDGRVKVSFSLSDGFADHEFLVVDNPVRNPLVTQEGLSIRSFQEYVCRAWENPDMALRHLEDRTLERWVNYAAGERQIADAIRYFRWEPEPTEEENLLFMALDMLQVQYPAPILPCGEPDMVDSLNYLLKPQWRATPSVVNFGLLSGNTPRTIPLFITSWKEKAGRVVPSISHPAFSLDTSRLAMDRRVDVSVNVDALQRGETVATSLSLSSSQFGSLTVPVIAARPNRVQGNRELGQRINLQAGHAALEQQSYHDAYRFFSLAQAADQMAEAEFLLLRKARLRHDWQRIIQLARHYNDTYGRNRSLVQLWLVEALRVVGGSIFQLGEHRRSLEYLAALACETAFLTDKNLLRRSWSSQPDAQLQLSADDPKDDWVIVTEHYGLNWTHATGRADGSNYAGEVPLDLSARRVVWRTGAKFAVKAPMIAYEGVLVARSADNRRILGLDAASGAILWQHTDGLLGQPPAAPVAGDGRVFVADPGGGLYGLNVLTGKVDWTAQLGDGRDISLAHDAGVLFVGLGKRVLIMDAATGEQLAATDAMTSFFGRMDSNPVNILVSADACLFQKVGGTKPSIVFLDVRTGSYYEFPLPVSRSSVGSFVGAMFGSTSNAFRWAAFDEEIYVPYLLTLELECHTKYRDSEGRVRDHVERVSWDELHLFVYHARQNQMLAHSWEVVRGTAYQENQQCRKSIKEISPANAIAVTPTYAQIEDGQNTLYMPVPGKPKHALVATSFGRDVYYWISTDKTVTLGGHRYADGPVQAIAYLGLYDMVTTPNSLSTSFAGNVSDGDSTGFAFPDSIGAVVGSPAIYGDVIYVTTKAGEVVAIGR